MSAIQWTEKTWNPIAGCSIVSTECKNCYAMKMAGRLEAMGQDKYTGITEVRNGHRVWNGTLRFDPDALTIPLKVKKPTLWFVNSMSDLFHKAIAKEWFLQIIDVMAVTPQHTYQVLTKRPERMAAQVSQLSNLERFNHVWWGTSVGYKPAVSRIDHLRETPAAVRFLSCEPLLEDLGTLDLSGIHWVIVGGESGNGARTMDIEWARNIVRQCQEQNVKVFVKQLGRNYLMFKDSKGGDMKEWPEDLRIRQYPAGRVEGEIA